MLLSEKQRILAYVQEIIVFVLGEEENNVIVVE